MAVLTVDGLTRAYPRDGFALRNVSFTVPEGHFAAVIGPSGAGKTSLLRLVAGLDRPDHGRVRGAARGTGDPSGQQAL